MASDAALLGGDDSVLEHESLETTSHRRTRGSAELADALDRALKDAIG